MSYSIRTAAASDAAFAMALYDRDHVRGQLHPPQSAEAFVASLQEPRTEKYVIELDERAYGFLALDLEGDWMVTVRAIAAWEPRRGCGAYGLQFAIRRAFDELRAHRIFLEVLESNVGARRLYEALGFRQEGLYRDGYRDDSGAFHNLVPYGILASDLP